MVFPVKTAYKILRDHEKELLGVFKLIEAIESRFNHTQNLVFLLKLRCCLIELDSWLRYVCHYSGQRSLGNY